MGITTIGAGGGAPTPDDTVRRAAERVGLACKALSAAVGDLRVAHTRSGRTAIDNAADLVGVELERVCELSEEIALLAVNLQRAPLTSTARTGE